MQYPYPSIQQFQTLVELKDYRLKTKREYVRYVCRLADHFQRDPATLAENDLRAYFLHLRQQQKVGPSGMTIARAALRCLFRECLKLGLAWSVFEELQIRRCDPLPFVLSRTQVAQLIGAIREPRFHVCAKLMYHCGLRVGEAVQLQVGDLLTRVAPPQVPRLRLRDTKGGKERFVPLAESMIEDLRAWWLTHRHRVWLFPSPGHGWKDCAQPLNRRLRQAHTHMSVSSVQRAVLLARAEAGLPPQTSPHTLRHCFATHLLEEEVSLRLISQYLGHACLETTLIYVHVTAVSDQRVRQAQQTLYQALKS